MDAFTTQQTVELCSRIGTKKSHTRLDKLFINACMTGPLLGFACAIVVSVNASPWYQENAPGLIRLLGALLFPIGLVMIVLTSADLFTSNIMFCTLALLHRRISVLEYGKVLFVSFFGNLAGMLFFMAIVTGYGGVFEETPGYKQAAITIAVQKAVQPAWHHIFLRAIGANWLVCLAVFMSISARDIGSKIIAIWWPTATFVALALDHVVANMYFIPNAIFVGAPAPLTTSYYIWKSLIPTTLGNYVAGSLFVALPYWYLYLTGEGGVDIAFNTGSLESAVREGAGPMGPSSHRASEATAVLEGQAVDSEEWRSRDWLPHSAGHLQSNLAKELSMEKCGVDEKEPQNQSAV
ncbi:hypothetical protein K491DRAFT_711866 [Lophiostoma macrostomum CBS 122681]|uniref:Formate/nitrite transporter n=1 Tax=Lophiostoma macrostomum CBS 122681 TaxID=1314788 RepID=A0A6A6TKV7_9PLEO|nr:hypothetical protein K491DRAFT_711866 [Lophiostoma macrostomum CBS 122681]